MLNSSRSLLVLAACINGGHTQYTLMNAAWRCAATFDGEIKQVDGVNCSALFTGSLRSGPETQNKVCGETPGQAGTGTCAGDGAVSKPGCILRTKLSPQNAFCIQAEYHPDYGTHGEASGTGPLSHTYEGKDSYSGSAGQPGDPLNWCNANAFAGEAVGYRQYDVFYCGKIPKEPPRGRPHAFQPHCSLLAFGVRNRVNNVALILQI